MNPLVHQICRWLMAWIQPRQTLILGENPESLRTFFGIPAATHEYRAGSIYDAIVLARSFVSPAHLLSLNYDGFCFVIDGDQDSTESLDGSGCVYLDLPGMRILQRTTGAIWLRLDPMLRQMYQTADPISLHNTPERHSPLAYKSFAEILDHYTLIHALCRLAQVRRYAELGVRDSPVLPLLLQFVPECHGIDTKPCALDSRVIFHQQTTDSFFASDPGMFDAIFVDADHSFAQVQRDLENCLQHVRKGGWIFLHDTYPNEPQLLGPLWCNDSHKVAEYLRLQYPTMGFLNLPIVPGLIVLQV